MRPSTFAYSGCYFSIMLLAVHHSASLTRVLLNSFVLFATRLWLYYWRVSSGASAPRCIHVCQAQHSPFVPDFPCQAISTSWKMNGHSLPFVEPSQYIELV